MSYQRSYLCRWKKNRIRNNSCSKTCTLGPKFQLHKEDAFIIYKLLIYFIHDEHNCAKYNLDLNKGILLSGPVGCGKTSLMTLMKYFAKSNFIIKSSRDIASEFHQDCFGVLQRYGKVRKIICLDDLGIEQTMNYFGNECNTIGEILLQRYDLMISEGFITHGTTNLNSQELEELYGNRVRSRFRSMFNLISFDNNVIDKRT